MKKVYYKLLQTISVKIFFAVVSFLLALLLFGLMVHAAFIGGGNRLDQAVFDFFDAVATDRLYTFTRFFTFFGKPEFLIPLYIVLVLYFIGTRQKKYAIEFGVLGATSTALLFGLKALFKRHRPDSPVFEHLSAYSFPSGHALLSFILSSFLIYWLWNSDRSKFWKYSIAIFLLLFSLAQGISRIILRVHYTTDVIAGFCIGYSWLLLSMWLQKKIWRGKPGMDGNTN